MSPTYAKWLGDAVRLAAEGAREGASKSTMVGRFQGIVPGVCPRSHRRALVSAAFGAFVRARADLRIPHPRGWTLGGAMTTTVRMAPLEKAANAADRATQLAAKGLAVGMGIEGHRAVSGVFYFVSRHQKPACGHKHLQGRLAVDRYWRSVLGKAGDLELLSRVSSYLREHDVPRIQDLVGAPTYLITRPYCRHRLVPVPTWEVVTQPIEVVEKNHAGEIMDHAHRTLSDAKRYRIYRSRRRMIASKVDSAAMIDA